MSPGLTDASGADNSDSWNSEKHFVRTPVDLHRKLIQISERPVALRIQSDIKRIMGFTEKLVCAESIKPAAASPPDTAGVPAAAAAAYPLTEADDPCLQLYRPNRKPFSGKIFYTGPLPRKGSDNHSPASPRRSPEYSGPPVQTSAHAGRWSVLLYSVKFLTEPVSEVLKSLSGFLFGASFLSPSAVGNSKLQLMRSA